ncbi:MAG: response regulator [Betaproteobacteria bacterium]|nr:response regulator [Betaproteobacteria bacterium]
MRTALRVLIVEDSEDDYRLIVAVLSDAGFDVVSRRVQDAPGMGAALKEPWDIVVSDHRMPSFSSTAALALLKDSGVDIPFIIASAMIGEDVAVEALHAGASDYVMKDNLRRLPAAVTRALRSAETQRARQHAELTLQESEARFRAITSNLPGMVFQLHYTPRDGEVRFSYVSEGAQALLGVSPAALLESPRLFLDGFHPEDRIDLESMLIECAQRLQVLHWEGRMRERWISINASPRELAAGLAWWEGIAFDVTREKQAELELRQSREQLRRLSLHIERAKEAERSRIAREIHDDIGGTLTAVMLDLGWMRGKTGTEGVLADKLKVIQQHVDSVMQASIRIARDLRPSLLDYGIVPAIEWQLGDFRKRLGIRCALESPPEDVTLEPEVATIVFRIFQESLTNISKHAAATSVKVVLDVGENDVRLQVADDGVGLTPEALDKPDSFGVRGMRQRVEELDGSLRIASSPGRGTTLELLLPRKAERRA